MSWEPIVLFILCLSTQTHGYKILAFMPFPTTSHQNIFVGFIKALAERGHEITYYTPTEPTVTHPNIKLKLTKNCKEEYLKELEISILGQMSVPGVSHAISRTSEVFSYDFYGNPTAQEIIHSSEKYDAILMESMFTQEPVSALIHKFGCVGIEISTMGDSAWINEFSGSPHNPAYQVDFKSELSHEMSIWQRIYNVYVIASTLVVSYYHMYAMQNIMDKYFNYTGWETRPSLYTLLANRSLILINSDPILSYPYPTAPHVKEIAGINIRTNQTLPKDLQTFMDEAKHGVIYFSFGSNIKTSDVIKGEAGRAFMKTFETLPQRVLMKWETDNSELKIPSNVKTAKWFPQTDVLAHKNCILFITHGGLLSLTETVYFGVPIIGIPFFTDQFKNLLQAQTMGYGLMIKYDNLTEDTVSWALREITTNPSYRDVVKKRSQIFRDRRHTAQEEAVYWIEYAIKYPNALLPKSAFMSFWEKRIFDVGTFSILSLVVLYVTLKFLVHITIKSKSTQKKKVKRS
ncbi:UDP-glucosyltransferase 2 [Halyomorpha halys]|uniref:UDP-glucosyltransferase 2 n=1 Tax=Halyomorpha halys TaxID=286706 RepID=UPI0006D50803|nr:2-hydroxyacylsphingosine 1-beta-galactosyltransferase-like [Halyomorpha halys]